MIIRRSGAAFIALTVLATAIFLPRPASAAQDLDCIFGPRLDAIEAVRADSSLDSLSAIRAELGLRKELLRSITGCGAAEVRSLKNKFETTNIPQDAATPRNRVIDRLRDAIAHYEAQREKIDGLGLGDSQELARELREWRRQVYTPLAEQTLNIIVWSKNQELFAAARNRFADIERTVSRLKLTENEDIARLFAAARTNFETAEAANISVRDDIIERTPTQGGLSGKGDTLLPIKQSLEALSATYKSFFDLSEATKDILPR